MNLFKLNKIKTIFCLFLFSVLGCKKDKEIVVHEIPSSQPISNPNNESPTISFTQPISNLVVTKDTLISFVVIPFDNDGTIERVEFSKNGTIIQTVTSSPYTFDWNILTENNIGTYIIKATAYDNQGATREAEVHIEIKSYLTQWLGVYEGTSRHWSTYPTQINGQWQIINNVSYKSVLVNITPSAVDSCLDFYITYNDSIIETKNGLKFTTTGTYFSQWGGGSGYGSLNIKLKNDSIKYNYTQKCGIPCNSGLDFSIKRQ